MSTRPTARKHESLDAGYFLFRPVDGWPIASAQVTEMSRRDPAQTHGQHDQLVAAGPGMKFDVNLPDTEAPAKPDGVAPAARTGTAPASASPAHDVETKDAKYYLERGILAYRSGDLYVAHANFDLAIDRDPNLSDSYINRGIVFHRLGDLKRAFSDVAKAQRIDDLNQKKSASGARTLEPYRL